MTDEITLVRGDVAARLVANAEGMVAHGMQTDVILVIQGMVGGAGQTDAAGPAAKARRSLENALAFWMRTSTRRSRRSRRIGSSASARPRFTAWSHTCPGGS